MTPGDPRPDPVRAITTSHPGALTRTAAGERLRMPLPYSSRLGLVLGGGGARAAYQVGILAELAERLPGLCFPIITGVSAGAINAAFLAAYGGSFREAVTALRERWLRLTPEQVYRVRPGNVLAGFVRRWLTVTFGPRGARPPTVRGLLDTAPLREFLTRNVDPSGIEANLAAGRLRAVALTATSFTTGRSVTFVHGGPDVVLWQRALREATAARLTVDHIMASAAIPLVFPAVRIGDAFYGDGGVRQLAPLAPALHLGASGLLAVGLRGGPMAAAPAAPGGDYPASAQIVGLLLDTVFLDMLEADAERLERVNQLLRAVPPERLPVGGLRPVNLLLARPSRDLGQFAAGLIDRLPPRVRWVIRHTGGEYAGASGFVSYLLFEPDYVRALFALAEQDVAANWPAYQAFFQRMERGAAE